MSSTPSTEASRVPLFAEAVCVVELTDAADGVAAADAARIVLV